AVVACAAPRRSTARVSVRGSPAAARAPAARAADGGRSAWSRGPHGRKTRWRAAPPVRQQRGHEHGTTTTRWRGGGGGGGGGGEGTRVPERMLAQPSQQETTMCLQLPLTRPAGGDEGEPGPNMLRG
ncbi:unnamed protein product, partial [Prorocentrum cordatum]